MRKSWLTAVGLTVVSVALPAGQSGPSAPADTPRPVASTARLSVAQVQSASIGAQTPQALVSRYCVTCHNARLNTANLDLAAVDLTRLGEHAEIGETIVRKLRAGMMPPTGAPRPDAATMESLVSWMESELDRSAVTHLPPPGLHRLNRAEYANAIRDLLALEVDATKFLPPDDSTRGFDNIAGALTMSPALMEAYLSAAGKISRLAIGTAQATTQAVFEVPPDTAQNHHVEGLPFGTRGGLLIRHQFPADGDYTFRVKGVTGYFTAVLGQITDEQLEISIDGERVHLFDWDRDIKGTTGVGRATPRIPVSAGLHTVGVTFIATNDLPGTELNRPFQRTMNTPGEIPGFQFYPHVGQVTIEGPFNATGASDTASRKAIFVCRPSSDVEEEACAERIVSWLATRAFRRPSTAVDVDLLMAFYRDGRAKGESFDEGIEAALQRILADPEFVYRREVEPPGLAAGSPYRVNDLELASRLSFFLWSSIPDRELIDLAAAGRLQDSVVFDGQVRRMLADRRSDALIRNFTGQWLGVRSLSASEPIVNLFPDFDDNLRNALDLEVELFFGSIVREDRSVVDLLDADYTFVNERLAKHYGIPNQYGSQFRRVTLPPGLDMRRGLLGKGALLTVTSQAARTSPVIRGKWFMQTFLGLSPPDPPPNVPAIQAQPVDTTGNRKAPTMRQVLLSHRVNPACVTCHQIFDPMGFALENFDAVGAWRTHEEGQPIDATGMMVDGTKLDGVASLRGVLLKYQDLFVQVMTEKLLTYALGRGVEHRDMPLVRAIARGARDDQYRFSSLVLGIVRSDAFQMNVKTGGDAVQVAAR